MTTATKDPQAFDNMNQMGKLANPICAVELDVWRRVIDMSTGEESSFVKRERMRTAREVFQDLHKTLDVVKCDKCGHEKKRGKTYFEKHDNGQVVNCGGEYYSLIDEYFNGPNAVRDDFTIPHDYRRVVCFPVTGGSEGHYWHVGVLVPDGHNPHWKYQEIALGKTFRGWDHCCLMANRCAQLLGA